MLAEKLYALRKRSGLSQEELAEKLDVSRQAVSKWELGTAKPDLKRLAAISRFYGVPTDALLSEDELPPASGNDAAPPSGEPSAPGEGKKKDGARLLPGVILAVLGAVLLLFRGLLPFFSPGAADDLAASSVIRLDGGAILAILAVLLLGLGVLLILPKKR